MVGRYWGFRYELEGGERDSEMGERAISNQGRGLRGEIFQGKDRERVGPVSLDDRKERHDNSSYWEVS